jgi:hypothetical protein
MATAMYRSDPLMPQGDMMEYHVYRLDPRGHILDRVDVFYDADRPAIQGAHSAFPRSDVELWQGKRRVGIFARERLGEFRLVLPGVPSSSSDCGICSLGYPAARLGVRGTLVAAVAAMLTATGLWAARRQNERLGRAEAASSLGLPAVVRGAIDRPVAKLASLAASWA